MSFDVYDERGHVIFTVPYTKDGKSGLKGYTSSTVNVQHGDSIDTYNERGNIVSSINVASSSGDACFIATTTFNSDDASELDWLREFRDKLLLKNKAGIGFVRGYYRNGPRLARILSGTRPSRATKRYLLLIFVRLGRKLIKLG